MSKRTLEMNRRRDRILDSARKLIGEQGYAHLTMRSLAEASGVTVPTIYNLIGNKDAVLGATIHDGTLRFWESTRRSSNPISILERIVNELLGQPAYYRPVLRALLNGGASDAMAELDGLFYAHLIDSLEAMVERDELERWIDCRILAERLLANLYGATSDWATGTLSDEALPGVAAYDACLTLAGVSTEKTRARFQARARKLQKPTIQIQRGRTPGRSASADRS